MTVVKNYNPEADADLLFNCPICSTPYWGKIDYDELGCQNWINGNSCTGAPIDTGDDINLFDTIVFYLNEECKVYVSSIRNKYNLNRITVYIGELSDLKYNQIEIKYTRENVNLIFDLARKKRLLDYIRELTIFL